MNKPCGKGKHRCQRNIYMTVLVPGDLSAMGTPRLKRVSIDMCVAPIVKALNEGGILTRGSCCGHGKCDAIIGLIDGREIHIKDPWKVNHKYIRKYVLMNMDPTKDKIEPYED